MEATSTLSATSSSFGYIRDGGGVSNSLNCTVATYVDADPGAAVDYEVKTFSCNRLQIDYVQSTTTASGRLNLDLPRYGDFLFIGIVLIFLVSILFWGMLFQIFKFNDTH